MRNLVKLKVKWTTAVSELHHTATGNHMSYGITQCYLPPCSGDFPALLRPKLVLDLAIPEGCKAELTWGACAAYLSKVTGKCHGPEVVLKPGNIAHNTVMEVYCYVQTSLGVL